MRQNLIFRNQIINYINGKRFYELNAHWKDIVKKIFPKIEDNEQISLLKYWDDLAKPNCVISYNKSSFNVRLLGDKEYVHYELFATFIYFLRRLRVSEQTIKTLTLYHFGTLKRGINIPLTYKEMIKTFPNAIKMANKELNSCFVLKKLIERLVIQGSRDYRQTLSFLYFGNVEKGVLLNLVDIENLIQNPNWQDDSYIHFGALILKPGLKNLKYPSNDFIKIICPMLKQIK